MKNHRSVTLLELLIAITLMVVIVLGLSSIDLFSRFHVLTADRRAKVQNEVSYILEHMSKEISKAIGNESIYGANSVISTGTITGDAAIRAYIDANGNGLRETTAGTDYWRAYRFRDASASPADRYQIWYCPMCTGPSANPCNSCNPAWSTNILTKSITGFTRSYIDDYVEIQLTACWDPDGTPNACGTPDNPNVTMSNHIKMPSVSTH